MKRRTTSPAICRSCQGDGGNRFSQVSNGERMRKKIQSYSGENPAAHVWKKRNIPNWFFGQEKEERTISRRGKKRAR